MKYLRQIAPTFGRFLVVGLSGTVVNLAALWFLVQAGLAPFGAALIATEISIINNFVWNDCWTFRKADFNSTFLSRFWRFQLVASLTAALTLGLFALLHNGWQLHYLLAQFIAIGLATIINFGINSKLTWKLENKLAVVSSSLLSGGTGKEIDEC